MKKSIADNIHDLFMQRHEVNQQAREFLHYIGPGILVAVGFLDPGNWAANVAAGSWYGYDLLWVISLSTVILIFLQHNAAHLGIATGLCLAEAATIYMRPLYSRALLISALAAAILTAIVEILGGAVALNMLFHIPIQPAAVLTTGFCGWLLWNNGYTKVEKIIIGLVSLVGLSLLFEAMLVEIDWPLAALDMVLPSMPPGSIPIIMSLLGSVVMSHNLFLHSEIIQSRQWNLQDEAIIRKQLRYEFLDTILSMGVGIAINIIMILVAAAVFFKNQVHVDELQQAHALLEPLLGSSAAIIFGVALLFSGIASLITVGMAGGIIFSGLFKEPYNIKDPHSWLGVLITYVFALILILFIVNPFDGMIYAQAAMGIQLPFTIFLQIYLTSSPKVMGKYANTKQEKCILWLIGAIVAILNLILFYEIIF